MVALLSPGEGYDTSTSLFFEVLSSQTSSSSSWVQALKQRLANRLVRWDAIYYVSIAERGYLYEQDWAFGWGFTRLISTVAERGFHHFCIRSVPKASNRLQCFIHARRLKAMQ